MRRLMTIGDRRSATPGRRSRVTGGGIVTAACRRPRQPVAGAIVRARAPRVRPALGTDVAESIATAGSSSGSPPGPSRRRAHPKSPACCAAAGMRRPGRRAGGRYDLRYTLVEAA